MSKIILIAVKLRQQILALSLIFQRLGDPVIHFSTHKERWIKQWLELVSKNLQMFCKWTSLRSDYAFTPASERNISTMAQHFILKAQNQKLDTRDVKDNFDRGKLK